MSLPFSVFGLSDQVGSMVPAMAADKACGHLFERETASGASKFQEFDL
jgi:hypothetical protein